MVWDTDANDYELVQVCALDFPLSRLLGVLLELEDLLLPAKDRRRRRKEGRGADNVLISMESRPGSTGNS